MYGDRCYICGEPMEAIDHVKPLTKGGSHWPANIRPICWKCNSTKNNVWPIIGLVMLCQTMK
jgi:5-methylcytosine-specific restriction endonuclease McrA